MPVNFSTFCNYTAEGKQKLLNLNAIQTHVIIERLYFLKIDQLVGQLANITLFLTKTKRQGEGYQALQPRPNQS